MPRFDITKLNVAIDKLIEVTQNPRHLFMLQAYARHRALELAGRFEEIFAPEMMSMNPVYHFNQGGQRDGAKRSGSGQEPVSDVGGDQSEHFLR